MKKLSIVSSCIVISLLLSTIALRAATGVSYLFHKPKATSNLTSLSVTDICQDEKGRIWIGTLDGLSCYDGTTFRLADNISNGKVSMGFMEVRRVVPDGQGSLYVLTTKGLFRVNLADESMEQLSAGMPAAICEFGTGIIAADNDGLSQYVRGKRQAVKLFPHLRIEDAGRYMVADKTGHVWISQRHGGLLMINRRGQQTRLMPEVQVTGLFIDHKGRIWVGSNSLGVYLLNPNGTLANHYNVCLGDRSRTFCEDEEGSIWVGSHNGLYILEAQGAQKHIEASPNRPGELTNNSVTSLYKDSQGVVWVGTYWGGINYVMPKNRNFIYYTSDKNPGLSSGPVGALCFDATGNLWISVEGGGLNVLDVGSQSFSNYNNTGGKLFSSVFIKDICFDRLEKCLWIVSDYSNRFNRFDLRSRSNEILTIDGSSAVGDALFDVDTDGESLYIGASNSVVKYDKRRRTSHIIYWCKNLFTHNYNSLLLDSKGLLWFAIDDGIVSYNIHNGTTKKYKVHMPTQMSTYKELINVLFETHDGHILAGTHNFGVYRLDAKTATFESYLSAASLNCKNVRSMGENSHGMLVLGTDNGVRIVDGSNSVFQIPQMPFSVVNRKSLAIDKDDNIYVGGSFGLMKIPYRDYQNLESDVHLMFTSLFVDDKEIMPRDSTGILSASLPYASRINIGPGHHVIALRYSGGGCGGDLNGNDVEYKLEGYNDYWTDVRSGNEIVFTNLPSGHYTLSIRLKQHHEVEASVALSVSPYWWASWWATILWVLLAAIVVFVIIREYHLRFYLQATLEFERKDKHRIAELDNERMRFFTDVSHDIRTPVTLILGQLEMILKSNTLSPYIRGKLSGIRHSAGSLKQLVDELLDFKKMESGNLELKIAETDLVSLMSKHLAMFRPMAKERGIELKFAHEKRQHPIWCDAHQLGKVFNNLLSNAFKNTADGGKIDVAISESDNQYVVKVSDNGSGMPPEVAAHVFERFYQGKDARDKGGTGIGLAVAYDVMQLHHGNISVESEPQVGTCFTLDLKKGNAHFGMTEKAGNESAAESKPQTQEPTSSKPASETTNMSKAPENSPKVLVVDDNKDIRNLVAEALSPFYEIITAVDGRDAMDKIKSGLMPDLVISDILMPRMSGSELCSQIKSNPKLRHIPVVMLTAIDAPSQEVEELKNGADLYIVKPFEMGKLVLQCHNLINMKNSWQKSAGGKSEVTSEPVATNAKDKDFIDKATKLVRNGVKDDKFSVEMLAKQMGVSRTVLFGKMKNITGQTPHAFISSIRLKEAAEMLRQHKEMTVSDISWALNFSTPDYFSRCFKKVFGMSPLQYRREKS